jgi:hypothetical protein
VICPLDADATLKGVGRQQTVSFAEMERMIKVHEVILKAMAGSLKSWETVEIIGVSDRTMMRWRERYQQGGYEGLYDRHEPRPSRSKPSRRGCQNLNALQECRNGGKDRRSTDKECRTYESEFTRWRCPQ